MAPLTAYANEDTKCEENTYGSVELFYNFTVKHKELWNQEDSITSLVAMKGFKRQLEANMTSTEGRSLEVIAGEQRSQGGSF